MEVYATSDFYKEKFLGEKKITDEKELKRLLAISSVKIDDVTNNRIHAFGFNNLTEFQKQKISDATCYQANYISEYGEEEDNIVGFSVLDISINKGKHSTNASKLNMSESAYSSLKQTGLMSGIL